MEEGKERGGIVTWFSGMRKSFSSNIPANRERSLKVITSIPPGTLIDHSFSYLVFNNVLKTFSQRYQQMFFQ